MVLYHIMEWKINLIVESVFFINGKVGNLSERKKFGLYSDFTSERIKMG